MSYLLDTTVITEPVQARPNEKVIAWMRETPTIFQFISVLTLGEIRKGVGLLAVGPHRESYRVWLEDALPAEYLNRFLNISTGVADRWRQLMASVDRSVPVVGSLIAATALHHDLRLVTRNERDFARFPGLTIVNPWQL